MKITTKSSYGDYYFNAIKKEDFWVVERKIIGWFGNSYEQFGTAQTIEGVLELCILHTPGVGAKIITTNE